MIVVEASHARVMKFVDNCFERLCLYNGGQKILAVTFCHLEKKYCNPYFTVIMIIVLIMIGFFGW
jgi:hypothetical protein